MTPLFALLGAALAGEPQLLPTTRLAVGDAIVSVEVADDESERAIGLMWRPQLAPDAGMLFVYPDQRPRSFWMKNTLVPLSIAFIDRTGQVVSLRDMQPMDTTAVPSGAPAMFAIEMNQGWFQRHGVHPGDQIDGLPGADAR